MLKYYRLRRSAGDLFDAALQRPGPHEGAHLLPAARQQELRSAFVRAMDDDALQVSPEYDELVDVNRVLDGQVVAFLRQSSETFRTICDAEAEAIQQQRERQHEVKEFKNRLEEVRARESLEQLRSGLGVTATRDQPSREGLFRRKSTRAKGVSTPSEQMSYEYQRMLDDLSRFRRSVADIATQRARMQLEVVQRDPPSLPEPVRELLSQLGDAESRLTEAQVERVAIPLIASQVEKLESQSPRGDVPDVEPDLYAADTSVLVGADLASNAEASGPRDGRSVFLVHGRDEWAAQSMRDFLKSLGLDVVEWDRAVEQTGEATPYVGDVVLTALRLADAIVVLFTPDDLVQLRPDLHDDTEGAPGHYGQARPNVIYEAGIADALAAKRTLLVQVGPVTLFSDLSGRHVVKFDDTERSRQQVAGRLKAAGLAADTTKDAWKSAGDFPRSIVAATAAVRRDDHAGASASF